MQPSANAAGQTDSYLTAVSCSSSATSCMAIGYSETGTHRAPPARRTMERLELGDLVHAAANGHDRRAFDDVACVNNTNCTIVGDTRSESSGADRR